MEEACACKKKHRSEEERARARHERVARREKRQGRIVRDRARRLHEVRRQRLRMFAHALARLEFEQLLARQRAAARERTARRPSSVRFRIVPPCAMHMR